MADLGSPTPAPGPKHDGAEPWPRATEACKRVDAKLVESELRHRFHNIVAIAQSLVNQTLRDDVPVADARESLSKRLAAMGSAVDLLLQNDWEPSSLHATLSTALIHPVDMRERIRRDGPDLKVGSSAVMTLTLALHELQTNAIKYGALSTPEGVVELFWKIVDGPAGKRLWMQWAERDGPPVQKPTKHGLGTRLISKATGRALGGEAELEYTPMGVTWFLIAPLDRISAS